jgi:hypothetical protein
MAMNDQRRQDRWAGARHLAALQDAGYDVHGLDATRSVARQVMLR